MKLLPLDYEAATAERQHVRDSKRPLAIEMFAGLGGWTEGMLAEGYECIGFDIERHDYGDGAKYPAQLVLQDVLTLHGKQFRDAALIVASPPCQEFSYMAMPWSRAKAIAADYRAGARDVKQLTALFDACFRIQREACEAAGRFIPLVVENVRGAQPWVGRSRWNYGSYHLWGDVPALMPMTKKVLKGGWLSQADGAPMRRDDGSKVPGFRFDGNGGSFQAASVEGVKQSKSGRAWFADPDSISGSTSSKSSARKAASAAIAKIPLPLARHIACVWMPQA